MLAEYKIQLCVLTPPPPVVDDVDDGAWMRGDVSGDADNPARAAVCLITMSHRRPKLQFYETSAHAVRPSRASVTSSRPRSHGDVSSVTVVEAVSSYRY